MPKMNGKPLPFHQDLGGGYERVTRAFARRAWSWGLPVLQNAGRGAVRLGPPPKTPDPNAKADFDAACLSAGPWTGGMARRFTAGHGRKCTYLMKHGAMALHFEFRDGSNPFLKYGTAAELLCELSSWSVRWTISPVPGTDGIAGYILEEKNPAPAGLFAPGP